MDPITARKLIDESDEYFGQLYKQRAAELKKQGKTDAQIDADRVRWAGTWKPTK